MATAREVAEWMAQEVEGRGFLDHETAVYEIKRRFGSKFLYENQHGNTAVDRAVLKEFRALTAESVVWESGERFWRPRRKHDPGGSRRAD